MWACRHVCYCTHLSSNLRQTWNPTASHLCTWNSDWKQQLGIPVICIHHLFWKIRILHNFSLNDIPKFMQGELCKGSSISAYLQTCNHTLSTFVLVYKAKVHWIVLAFYFIIYDSLYSHIHMLHTLCLKKVVHQTTGWAKKTDLFERW